MKTTADLKVKSITDVDAINSATRQLIAHIQGVEPAQVKAEEITSYHKGLKRVRVVWLDESLTPAFFEKYNSVTDPRSKEGAGYWVDIRKVSDDKYFTQNIDGSPKSARQQELSDAGTNLRAQVGFGGVTAKDENGELIQNLIVNCPVPTTVKGRTDLAEQVQKTPFLHVVALKKGQIRPIKNARTGQVFEHAVFEVIVDGDSTVSGSLQANPWMEAADTVVDVSSIEAMQAAKAQEADFTAKAKLVANMAQTAELDLLSKALPQMEAIIKANAMVSDATLAKYGLSAAIFNATEIGKKNAELLAAA